MSLNVEAPLFLTQALLPQLEKGRVLNISSGAAYFPVEAWGAYCTSKAALSMVTRIWQEENPHMEIASVMPGITDTEMQDSIRQSDTMGEDKLNFFKEMKQDNRLVSSETVASFLTWLLLDISGERFRSIEWDIYDASHHSEWMREDDKVPPLE